VITDSLGNKKQSITFGEKDLDTHFVYKETVKLRNINPDYITLCIASGYKIGYIIGTIFNKNFLLLISSVILIGIMMYGLILQIKIINRQNKIAEMRQDFSHAMIHDLKNPITSIIMGVNSLKSGKVDEKPTLKERYYTIITQESERMLKLANRVLEIAQFDGQQVVLNKEHINLHDLITSLTDKYLLVNPTKNINFHVDLDGVETIHADLHYISEAFDNLIDNAVKYSKDNVDPEISITASFIDKNTQIIFKDNGIGISVADQKKIFQKFERSMAVIKNQKKVSGFGLGLNYVYQVVKAHGGSIKVNSQLGSYSEFIINLPSDGKDKIVVS
jgi:two-component system phosphate regulon sensor histidine kinase PhoR